MAKLLYCLIGFFVVALPSLAAAGPLENFASATCALKASIGTRSNKKAVIYMINGIPVDPRAMNAWRANTGGNTYYGNVDAGRNMLEFYKWFKSENYPIETKAKLLLDAVNKQCKGVAGDSTLD